MKKVGIIGGLGPMATSYFLQLVTMMTEAKTDQEHIECMIISKPQIPDRTQYILGKSKENPFPLIAEIGNKLQEMGAELIVIPCITAHYFYRELEKKLSIPLINGIKETGVYLKECGITKVGILATDGTLQSQIFQKVLIEYGIESVLPSKKSQKDVMMIIYDCIKAGESVSKERLEGVSQELRRQGAQVILLGCTELSLIKRDIKLENGYLDVMDILAKKTVECCGVLRKEYRDLITK